MIRPLLDLREFLFEAPLYARFSVPSGSNELAVLYSRKTLSPLDGHCPHCKRTATFIFEGCEVGYEAWDYIQQRVSWGDKVWLTCTRNDAHRIAFILRSNRLVVEKIGQFPSLADIALDESKIYSSVLNEEDGSELHKAIGLASHGVGVGSFVYLRRVFENLVQRRFEERKEGKGWNDEDFSRLHMDEKVGFLRDFLPAFMVDNRRIYAILSKGLHELTEEECLKHFPVLRQSIMFILEEDKEAQEKRRREEQLKGAISAITG